VDLRVYDNATPRANLPTDLEEIFVPNKTPDLPLDYQLPQLERLTIPAQNRYRDAASVTHLTSDILRHSINWTKTTQLKLFGVCPQYCFEQLEGRVPNLKSLNLELKLSSSNDYAPTNFRDITVVKNFISSVNGFEELKIKNYAWNIDVLIPAILQHRGSLQSLIIHTPSGTGFTRSSASVWTTTQLEQLLNFSELSHLELDISHLDAIWVSL
jgi:hypothetical protein